MLLVTDYNNNRVVTYDPLVEFVGTLGNDGLANKGDLIEPISVAASRDGWICVAGVLNHQVRAFQVSSSPGKGVVLNINPGSTFNFDQLSVRSTTEAFMADNSGTIIVGGNHFVFGTWATLVASDGQALDITDTTLSDGNDGPAIFGNVTSLDSPNDGVSLNNVCGD